MSLSFVHLNAHSNFSLLSGTRSVHELVGAARLMGMSALALTDTNGLYAAVEFQRACRASDVHPVFGAELRHDGKRAVLLARDAEGYAEICRLVTQRHLDEEFRLSAALASTGDHVFVLCGDPALLAGLRGRGNVYVELTCHHDVQSRRRKYQMLDIAERLRLPLVATNNVHFLRRDEHRIHRVLCAIRTNTTVGTVPPGEVEHEECFMRSPGEMAALFDDVPQALSNSVHIAWSCHYEIALGRPRPPRFELPDDASRRVTPHRMMWRRHVAERLTAAHRTPDGETPRVLPRPADGRPIDGLPEWPRHPRGLYRATRAARPRTQVDPGTATHASGQRVAEPAAALEPFPDVLRPAPRPPPPQPPAGERARAFEFLRRLCDEGLRERLPEVGEDAGDALEREHDVIHRLDLTAYFLVCWDLVRFARAHGMPCLGRGSAANSLVSYCLYITHVNPLEHNLFFERFLNLERESYPDFDIDFGTDDREVVLDYIFERYGRENVAMICTYVTMHARSAVREVAKALGIPSGEFEDVVKRLPHFASARGVRERVARDPARRDLPLDREPFRSILEIAERIAEFPRHLATHPCGLVIAPEPILGIVPLQRGDKGLEITQWNMDGMEDAGLIKIDILGQKGLEVISDTIRQVESNDGLRIDPERVDALHDERGRDILRTGRTVGCFYIESPIMLQLMEQAGCDDFEVLTALSSIIRPGVSNYGGKRQYLECHLGLRKPEVLHPLLEPVLRDTYGCLIYQEQVIQVAQTIAGMTLAEADGLRKCMSKKRNWQRMETYRERFMSGARRNGVPDDVAGEIFRQIQSFAGYAFCKAHSASFALESFESAYWKARYPAEFMAAVLTNQGGYYTPMEYAEEARRFGLRLLPPCVNTSRKEFWGRGREVRVGLMQVKGLSDESIDAILDARRPGGAFRDLGDFLRRVPVTHPEARSLVRCGAMDAFSGTRPRLLWELELRASAVAAATTSARPSASAPAPAPAPSTASPAARTFLAPGVDTERVQKLVAGIPELREYDAQARLRAELEVLEMTLETHPFALFGEVLDWVRARRPVVPSIALRQHEGEEVYLLGWKVTSKRTTTVNDESMCFVTFSDPQGRFEASFFPEVYERCARELIRGFGPYVIKGRVEVSFGVAEVVASNIKLLSPRRPHDRVARHGG
ncbi:MAG: DNA polymerase III subunit alpha [Candidatus Krumholzibacteriia bacterium]